MPAHAPMRDENTDDHIDDHVDDEIATYLDIDRPRSFFLFAGAGSGKTGSLVTALRSVRKQSGARLRLAGRRIGVITYTNAACDEIIRRLDHDPLFGVSTIHSFVWDLIQGFNTDIRVWLTANLPKEIAELQEEIRKGRPGTKAALERPRKLRAKQKRLESLPSIRRFIYSPTGENQTRDSLNHSEVIKICADFLERKVLLQKLLIDRFPILLIDESQDTNKLLMGSLLTVQKANPDQFGLGLFGDMMQRIYADGKVDLDTDLPGDWAKPSKVMNHRCPHRVVRLINKIRASVDHQVQHARSDAREGWARLFIAVNSADRALTENRVRARMVTTTVDPLWEQLDQVKTLILEHHMAAARLMFFDMFEPLYKVESFRTALLDGSLPCLRLFSELVLPSLKAKRAGSEFSAAALVRKWSPLLREDSLKAAGADQRVQLAAASAGLTALVNMCSGADCPTFRDVLRRVAAHKLFDIPETLDPFCTVEPAEISEDGESDEDGEGSGTPLAAIRNFLETRFGQIEPYALYVGDKSAFGTHQGVKGLEFPRVLVVMDDATMRGFSFGYDKLFGAKAKTKSDSENERAGTETGIDRTRRLFYVTCSRAKESLAIIAYTSDTAKVKRHALEQGWFDENEIEVMA
ncbi:MAG: hypothetical protein JWN40_1704 [Phycisphaerales bacterium]|nr:hypothetical protein [Phycisphaerales bacterium]